MLLNYFWRYFFKGSLVEIFAEKVAKGNSVQIDPNFPAKSLVKYFLDTLLLIQLKIT